MSWMKRPQGGAAGPPAPDQPPYNTAQSYGGQQNLYPNYQTGDPSNAQQQQYWQTPQQQPQYNQQYGQVYQQQEYGSNANQYYQQPMQYNQNYGPNYATAQQGFQQNYYQNPGQPNYSQNKSNADAWEDNWDWGWEDSSKQAQKVQNITPQTTTQLQTSQPQQVFNNANIIEESFAATDSWNWPVDDKKGGSQPPAATASSQLSSVESTSKQLSSVENNSVSNSSRQIIPSNASKELSTDEIKTLNDREVIKEHLPNLALGKRFHLENLTPQWSIESQMSQESSDGPHTHSEGTYRSENQSRNSNKSSPGLNTDNSNFNYSQAGIDELYSTNVESVADETTLVEQDLTQNSTHDTQDEISSSLQEMSISNSENPVVDNMLVNMESNAVNQIPENVSVTQASAPNIPSTNVPSHSTPGQVPTLSPSPQLASSPVSNSSILPPPSSSVMSLPPPPSLLPPPKNLPQTSQNPYKLSGPFSHKNITKGPSSNPPVQQFSSLPTANLTSPAVVNKISQHNRVTVGFGANLETTPDNSERPDQPQVQTFRSMSTVPQVPENLEIAPQNDRNEYLQTAHLSSGDYEENTDFSRNLPPPGLRRMVVGQQETEYTQNLNIAGDEPPPGLARMVPGQQNESQSVFNQANESYMDRHIDGQPMENSGRPYRQAEGQQTSDNYNQSSSVRSNERRPIGLDRMVPGESSTNDYSQYQANSYVASNEERVVTGVDHEYDISTDDPGLPDVREQIMDGSEYTEHPIRNPRNIIGARESSNNTSPDFSSRTEERQREVIMEGENLQDLSIVSLGDLTFSRDQTVDGADLDVSETADRKIEAPESTDRSMGGSRRQSLSHVNTSGEDTSERERLVKSSPRRDTHKSSREREKEGRYSRGDRKYDRESERRGGRDERRSERDRRDRDRDRVGRDRDRDRVDRERGDRDRDRDRDRDWDRERRSPDARRQRRSVRPRPPTDDTDYYSDRDRDRDRDRYHRRQREGSYTSSKPPRHEGSRYRDEREYRRYNTIERENARAHRERYDDRYEHHQYRDIDPSRKYGNLRKERDEERKRGTYSPSREARDTATDDDERERRRRRHHRHRDRDRDDYYAGYEASTLSGGAEAGTVEGTDAYTLQYQYYEHLRRTNPAAYLQLYKRLVQPALYTHGAGVGVGGVVGGAYGEERGSLQSGRSSAAGLKHDTFAWGAGGGAGAAPSLLDAPSLRTDLSDRDLNTDASLNLHLEESTVRSERMTPFRYSTAHIKASISSRHLVVVSATYPVDGRPARVCIAALQPPPAYCNYPGPLIKGVTHKKSVIEYCESRARQAGGGGRARDALGHALLWQLLALLLRQNGVVVGTDIAELLMKNAREYEYESPSARPAHDESRRESSMSGSREDEPQDVLEHQVPAEHTGLESASTPEADGVDPVDRFRELLISGNRQEALEWALSHALWGHALALAWHGGARARAAALGRFVTSLGAADPLHSLYCALQARAPPAATNVSSDWRAHAAILLANPSSKPEHDRRTLIQLGDTLSAKGLIYSAQFCYVSAGVPFSAHPLAPFQPPAADPGVGPVATPRLCLLLADHRAPTFQQFATDEAIFATEIYEYALSLNQDYVIKEFLLYKLVLASRLSDAGLHERALQYCEQACRLTLCQPPPPLLRALATLADRLRYSDGMVSEEGLGEEAGEGVDSSPRHRWLDDVTAALQAQPQSSPQHAAGYYAPAPTNTWTEQAQQYQQPASYSEPVAADTAPDYGHYYHPQDYPQPPPDADHDAPAPTYGHQPHEHAQQSPEYTQQSQDYTQQSQPYSQLNQDYGQQAQDYNQQSPDYGQEHTTTAGYGRDEHSYADNYWQGSTDYGYGEAGAGAEQPRPMITMPGASATSTSPYDDDRPPSAESERETDTPQTAAKKAEAKKNEAAAKQEGGKKSGWLGGILTRLSLRPPNQMILPDDSNPTIVWDAENKRWRNLDGDEDAPAPPPPPPRAAPPPAPALLTGAPPPTGANSGPTPNIFKMQKSRHIKKSYVDVFNPGGAASSAPAPPPPADLFPPAPAPHQGGIGMYEPQLGDESYRSGI